MSTKRAAMRVTPGAVPVTSTRSARSAISGMPRPTPGLSARAHAEAVVGDGDLDAFVVQARGHVDLAGALAVAVRVHDGVRHRF